MNVGDRVLLANKRERGKRKTADRWESCIYIVTEMNSEVHTFRIRNTATGTEKVVHRNLSYASELPASAKPKCQMLKLVRMSPQA